MSQISSRCCTRRRRHIRGTTIVEAAFVLPVFFTFVLGLIEYGHAQMVSNVIKSACRAGARYGCTEGATTATATARVNAMLNAAAPSTAFSVMVKDASVYDQAGASQPSNASEFAALPNVELSSMQSQELFLIRVTVPYNSIAIMPVKFMSAVTLSGQAFMRHE